MTFKTLGCTRWGYRRIQGEALKLGVRISHMGVAKILRSRGIPPAPRRSQTSWRRFVRHHAAQILATDFFTVETTWLQRLHVLFFIELASRKVHLAGITASPTGEWVAQQARNLAWKLQDGALKANFLLRDRDSKFTAGFDQVLLGRVIELTRVRLPHTYAGSASTTSCRSASAMSDCCWPSSWPTTTRIALIDRSLWRLRWRIVVRPTGRWSPGLSTEVQSGRRNIDNVFVDPGAASA